MDDKWRLETAERLGQILEGVNSLNGEMRRIVVKVEDHIAETVTAHGGSVRTSMWDHAFQILALVVSLGAFYVSYSNANSTRLVPVQETRRSSDR